MYVPSSLATSFKNVKDTSISPASAVSAASTGIKYKAACCEANDFQLFIGDNNEMCEERTI